MHFHRYLGPQTVHEICHISEYIENKITPWTLILSTPVVQALFMRSLEAADCQVVQKSAPIVAMICCMFRGEDNENRWWAIADHTHSNQIRFMMTNYFLLQTAFHQLVHGGRSNIRGKMSHKPVCQLKSRESARFLQLLQTRRRQTSNAPMRVIKSKSSPRSGPELEK
ncbi:hypothetical protein BD410DRAFT_614355 [Rickenella mellea]|uniref:Uncharacterized protein n=1 Tax=Rickenella mellea TaxID=50990 RepID=A0A4Y7PQ32_9AGAM|nr:hypothetical protein BD410DRAFT_614355 [Rickenella mellea]